MVNETTDSMQMILCLRYVDGDLDAEEVGQMIMYHNYCALIVSILRDLV